jgi:hypothetical protein
MCRACRQNSKQSQSNVSTNYHICEQQKKGKASLTSNTVSCSTSGRTLIPRYPSSSSLGAKTIFTTTLLFGRSFPTNSSRLGASSMTSSLKPPKSPYRRARLLDRKDIFLTPTTFLSFTHSSAVQCDSIACRECSDMVTLDR